MPKILNGLLNIMARITKPLTNTEVERAKAKTKDYSLYDGGGLTILIRPNGAKLWRFRYARPFSNKRALIGLGQYPSVTLAQARSIKDEYLSLLAQKFPFGDKQPNRPMNKETVNNAIRSMGYGGKLVAHGLRSIASTYLNETFLEQYDVIEACLSHEISNAVRKAYNRSNYLEQRKPIMQSWGDYVESCSTGL